MQKPAKLSVCMIAKNEEIFLPRTLPSYAGVADEIIIVDTGSGDRTVEIAKEFGAKLYDYKWNADFAAARNESIRPADGDWILWVDADEYITPEGIKKIKEALSTAGGDITSFFLPLTECKPYETVAKKFYFREKIFRNKIGYKFERKINERLVLPKGVTSKNGVVSGVVIYHWGRGLSADKMQQKYEKRISIYKAAIEKDPGDPVYRFLLAELFRELNRNHEAIAEYDGIIKNLPKDKPHWLGAVVRKARAFWSLGQYENAIKEAKRGLEIDPDFAEALLIIGQSLNKLKRHEEAIEMLSRIPGLEQKMHPVTGLNHDDYNYSPYLLMGLSYFSLGKKQEAKKNLSQALKVHPGNKNIIKLLKTIEAS